jgi:hypothetical protein
VSRWPFPGDLPVDRARQVALQYRELLMRVDPDACAAVDAAAVLAGEGWVAGEWAIETEEDLVTVPRAAELVGRSTRWVYQWARDHGGGVNRSGRIKVRLLDVRAAVAHERARRAESARAQPS